MKKLQNQLLKAQTELKAPKGQYNSFGKYKYRNAEDILEAAKPVNDKHGLTLVLTDEPVLIGDWHYIKATARISHEDDSLEVTAYARESLNKKGMDDSQITGTASSYARKYALNGLYLIDDTKDADTDEHRLQGDKQPNKPKVKVASEHQVKQLKSALAEYAELTGNDDAQGKGKLSAWALGQLEVENYADIPAAKITPFIAKVKKKIESQKEQEQESLFEGTTTKPKA